jgi:tetratricopeptide (TPR) repeat protein
VTGPQINGWKAIGAYLGRDRTTAIRWANERGLPVHKVPGGQTATVYALTQELDDWSSGVGVAALADQSSAAPVGRKRSLWLWAALAVVAVLGLALYFGTLAKSVPAEQLPDDPKSVALLKLAREQFLKRDIEHIRQALASYTELARREPDFAPGLAELAEAHLQARNFGVEKPDVAFQIGNDYAKRALAIDPDSPKAHLFLGNFNFYWSGNRKLAGKHFRRAIELSPNETATRGNYAVALVWNGELAAARRQFEFARKNSPDIPLLETQYAMVRWHEGDLPGAAAELERLIKAFPASPLAYAYLSDVRMEQGRYREGLQMQRKIAEMKMTTMTVAEVDRLSAILDQQGGVAMLLAAAKSARASDAQLNAAFYSALGGDRFVTLACLNDIVSGGDPYRGLGYLRPTRTRWKVDREIMALLDRLKPEPMEP